jgi:hypothetical protein
MFASCLLDQRVDLADAGLRGELGGLVLVAQHAEHSPHLGQRSAAGFLDAFHRFVRLSRVDVEQSLSGIGL